MVVKLIKNACDITFWSTLWPYHGWLLMPEETQWSYCIEAANWDYIVS